MIKSRVDNMGVEAGSFRYQPHNDSWRQMSRTRLSALGVLYSLTFTLAVVFLLAFSYQVGAQTLDFGVQDLLGFDCLGLGTFGGGAPGELGPGLREICVDSNVPSPGASTGGGAGSSPQTFAISVENRRRERLEKKKDNKGNKLKSSEEEPVLSSAILTFQGMSANYNLNEGWGVFVLGNFESLDRDTTTFATGYNSSIYGVTGGVDYTFTDQVLGGVAFTWINQDGDFRKDQGDFVFNTYGVMVFGSYLPAPGFFVDLSAGYARKNYSVSRAASFKEVFSPFESNTFAGIIDSDTDGNEIQGRLLLGYDHPIGNVTIGPRLGLNYTYDGIDSYSERNGGPSPGATGLRLRYSDQDVNSLQSVLGFMSSMAISTNIGFFIPQLGADFIHEFANSQKKVKVRFVEDLRSNPMSFQFQTEKPVRDFFNIRTGLIAYLPYGFQPYINFRVMVGNEQFDNYAGTVGLRIAIN